jgi:hypothetical protein
MEKLILIGLILFSFSKCSNPNMKGEENTIKQIKALEEKVLGKDNIPVDTALMLVRLQEAYAKAHPGDSLSAIMLYKAADIARGAGEPGLAIKLWGTVTRKYPDFPKAAESLFLQAFTFENEIKDENNARVYYENFINRYPEHEYVEVAKMALENLGKRPEELIKEFEKNAPE